MMQIELNQVTFRRLVQLYLVTLAVTVAIVGLEYLIPRWVEFSDRFDTLVTEIFGPAGPADAMPIPVLVMLTALMVWNVASCLCLLWFRRWARIGIWASALAMYGEMVLMDGYRPTYSTPGLDILATLDGMLLGAIVLLAYARNYGADWFAAAPTNRQE